MEMTTKHRFIHLTIHKLICNLIASPQCLWSLRNTPQIGVGAGEGPEAVASVVSR